MRSIIDKSRQPRYPPSNNPIILATNVTKKLDHNNILSYDAEGNEMYIEVKTTLGTEDSSFFISANELEKSELYAENYYLYRVYEFDMKNVQGKYSVRKGSLEDLCLIPQTYRVDLKEKNANEESDN